MQLTKVEGKIILYLWSNKNLKFGSKIGSNSVIARV